MSDQRSSSNGILAYVSVRTVGSETDDSICYTAHLYCFGCIRRVQLAIDLQVIVTFSLYYDGGDYYQRRAIDRQVGRQQLIDVVDYEVDVFAIEFDREKFYSNTNSKPLIPSIVHEFFYDCEEIHCKKINIILLFM